MGPVVIVGAGAIGAWLAAHIARIEDGPETVLLARPAQRHALQAQGLRLEVLPQAGDHPETRRIDVPSHTWRIVDDPVDLPKAPGLVVFAVRAYQTARAARDVADAGVRPDAVLTLQNGLGNAETLAEVFGPDRVLAGATSHGVTKTGLAAVRHAGRGDTALGPWTGAGGDAAADAAALLTRAGIETTLLVDPRPALWRKVAVNAAINPLTALERVENGKLLDGGALERTMRAAAREAAHVATAEGVPLAPDEAEVAAVTVAERTAANRSSMLQAREAGVPLESDAITGEVIRRAAAHGLEVPVNAALWERLRAL